MVALAGQLVFNQAVANVRHLRGGLLTILAPGYDFWTIWYVDNIAVHGQRWAGWYSGAHWYGPGISNAWPPPHEVLLAPFGFLSSDAAHVVSIVLTAALMVAVVLTWSQAASKAPTLPSPGGGGKTGAPGGRGKASNFAWPFLFAAPLLSVVWIDQLQAALGLAALSLAVWAQRREKWWLVGIAASVAMIRVLNAIPVLCILLLSGWGKPRQLGIALGAAAAFMAPLLLISYQWDHTFATDYVAGLTAYPYNATARVATQSLGVWGLVVLLALITVLALWLVRKDVGRPLDPGRAGLGMALTVAITPLGGLYPGIFTLPALIRLGQRRGYAALPWMVALGPWLVILALSPILLRPSVGMALNFLSFIDYGLLVLCYPLLRLPPEAEDRSTGQSGIESPAA